MKPRQIRLIIIRVLTIFLFSLLSVEVMLRLDPIGVMSLMAWNRFSLVDKLDHPTGFSFASGEYRVSGETVTIDEQGNRITPVVNDPDCTIATIGDSVTWGWGVSDTDTFPYVLGTMYPDVQIINTARPSYNLDNLSRSVDYWEADGYIYLMVINDAQEAADSVPFEPPRISSAISTHVNFLRIQQNNAPQNDLQAFSEVLSAMSDKNLMLFSIDTHALFDYATTYTNTDIPVIYVDQISATDTHPSPNGHAIIAEAIAPAIPELCANS